MSKSNKATDSKKEKAKEEEIEEVEEVEEEETEEENEEETEETEEEEATDSKKEKATSKKEKATSAKDSVDIVQRGKTYVRTYSKAVHGKDYLKLAQSLVDHYPTRKYTIVPSSEIKAVEVRYREKEDAHLHPDKQKIDAPMVDKTEIFTDKEKALGFNIQKKGAVVIRTKPIKQ